MSSRRALCLSLTTGILAALGAGGLLLIAYVFTGLWLAGHNQTLLGWNGTDATGIDWPNLVWCLGSISIGMITTRLCYRAWRPPEP